MILSSGLSRRWARRFALPAVRSPSVVGFHHVGRPAPVRGLSPPVWIFRYTGQDVPFHLTPNDCNVSVKKMQIIIYTRMRDLSSIDGGDDEKTTCGMIADGFRQTALRGLYSP